MLLSMLIIIIKPQILYIHIDIHVLCLLLFVYFLRTCDEICVFFSDIITKAKYYNQFWADDSCTNLDLMPLTGDPHHTSSAHKEIDCFITVFQKIQSLNQNDTKRDLCFYKTFFKSSNLKIEPSKNLSLFICIHSLCTKFMIESNSKKKQCINRLCNF